MEHLVTLAAAILGSSILSTAVGFIAARYNPTRHVETLQAWNTERLLLSELESKAGIIDDEASTSARNVALATAARTQVNAAVTTRLIPKNSLSSSVALVSGLLLSLLAATAVIAGIFFGLYLFGYRHAILVSYCSPVRSRYSFNGCAANFHRA